MSVLLTLVMSPFHKFFQQIQYLQLLNFYSRIFREGDNSAVSIKVTPNIPESQATEHKGVWFVSAVYGLCWIATISQ